MESSSEHRKPNGYIRLAQFMVQRNHTIVKQYRELAVQDLLYLQAELCHLQYEFNRQATIDANEKGPRSFYDREWTHLQNGLRNGGDESIQWRLALLIRGKLRDYCECLPSLLVATASKKRSDSPDSAIHAYRSIGSLPRPNDGHRKIVHEYMFSPSLGGDLDFLGRDLGDSEECPSVFAGKVDDLVFLGDETGEDDVLSRFLAGPALSAFHMMWKRVKVGCHRSKPKL